MKEKFINWILVRIHRLKAPFHYGCESCHNGLYCYQGLLHKEGSKTAVERWCCNKCGAEAPVSWKKKHNCW
jgi:hypothetical protein